MEIVFSLPALVDQISSSCFVVFQVLLELVVDRPRMVLQKQARKKGQQKHAPLPQKTEQRRRRNQTNMVHVGVCESAASIRDGG